MLLLCNRLVFQKTPKHFYRDLNYDKFVVNGKVQTMADESYTSHNTTRLDVEGTVDKILTTEYVQHVLQSEL